MGYQLQAVLAGDGLLRRVTQGRPDMHVIELAQVMALMPMTARLFDDLTGGMGEDSLGFFLLPVGFDQTLARWSADGPVAYVEAEFFGGTGSQSAAVWAAGVLTFGPLHEDYAAAVPLGTGRGVISQALRHLGVTHGRFPDEFMAAGLDRHRHNDGWLAEIGVQIADEDR